MNTKHALGIVVLILIGVGLLLPATRDELRWFLASSQDKTQSYARYLTAWPGGRHAAEARSRYEDKSWGDARTIGTPEAYLRYDQTHPGSSHSAEARKYIEELVWQQSTNANTVRALETYAQAYPQGRFRSDAQARQKALRADERPFAIALEIKTARALERFLTDFPGHEKEGEARQALKELTDGRDIVDLQIEKKIEIRTQGSGIQNVSVSIRKLVPYPLTVRIPVGSYFVSASLTSQNMVATEETTVRLTSGSWQTVSPSAACANLPRTIPTAGDSFSVERSPHQEDLARLLPLLAKADYSTRQAAVWIVTDNATYDELGKLVIRRAFEAWGGSRTINENETAKAMMICDEAGIDITKKAIWKDRLRLLGYVKGKELNWLEEKGGSLLAALRNKDPQVRRLAASVMAGSKVLGPQAVEPLLAALRDTDAEVRHDAASALGRTKDPRAVEPLLATLDDSDPGLRWAAEVSLGEIGDRRAFEPLLDKLTNNPEDRWRAASALGLLKDQRATEPLIRALRDYNWIVRSSAAYALGELADPRAVRPLIRVIDDKRICEVAARALVSITGDTNGLPKGDKELNSTIEHWKAYGARMDQDPNNPEAQILERLRRRREQEDNP